MTTEQGTSRSLKLQTAGDRDRFTVALAGQPNVGKSTIFNLITGLSQHVGNWPGKTVEKREGFFEQGDATIRIVDLPGTYSLSANSPEEQIARQFIITERPDAVIVIVDATVLERSLYLVSELLWLPSPIVIGVNMVDVAEQNGIHIEAHVLEAALGVPVVPMVATKNRGVRELMEAVERLIRTSDLPAPSKPDIRQDHKEVLTQIKQLLDGRVPDPYPADWVALKLLEGDELVTHMMADRIPSDRWEKILAIMLQHEDATVAVAGGRYDWIRRMVRVAVTRPQVGQVTVTERLDRIATHPFWGLLTLIGVLGSAFWLTYSIGTPLQEYLDIRLVQGGARWVYDTLGFLPAWLTSLLGDGVIGGAGMVLTLVPILVIFFTVLGLLEDVGYMSRAAYVMDRYMHRMGLHGKSFLPLCLGFGCNVPAVMGARIIDLLPARILTILLTPLVPCTARLAVIAVLVPIFFGAHATVVTWGLLSLNVFVLAALGTLFHKTVLDKQHIAFIMEMPLYHVPNLRTIGISVWKRITSFVRTAGSIILIVAVVIWVLSTLPYGDMESSFLAHLGRLVEPLGRVMGLDWRMMVALMSSFLAKENTLATLGVLFGAGTSDAGLAQSLQGVMTPAAGLAFLVVQMLFIPCTATLAAIRHETGSWKWTLAEVALLLVVSFTMGILVYNGARFLGW